MESIGRSEPGPQGREQSGTRQRTAGEERAASLDVAPRYTIQPFTSGGELVTPACSFAA